MRHVIKKQRINLKLASVQPFSNQQEVYQLQRQVSEVYRKKIIPLMDRCFESLGTTDSVYRINQMVLELGELRAHCLEDDLIAQVSKQLPLVLAHHIKKQAPVLPTTLKISKQLSDFDQLVYFLRTGTLAWWANGQTGPEWEQKVEQLIKQSPRAIQQVIQEILPKETLLKRLIYQFSDRLLSKILRLFMPNSFPFDRVVHPDWGKIFGRLPQFRSFPKKQVRLELWQARFLTFTFNPGRSSSLNQYYRDILLYLAACCRTPYPNLLNEIITTVSTDPKSFQERGVKAIVLQLQNETQVSTALPSNQSKDASDIELLHNSFQTDTLMGMLSKGTPLPKKERKHRLSQLSRTAPGSIKALSLETIEAESDFQQLQNDTKVSTTLPSNLPKAASDIELLHDPLQTDTLLKGIPPQKKSEWKRRLSQLSRTAPGSNKALSLETMAPGPIKALSLETMEAESISQQRGAQLSRAFPDSIKALSLEMIEAESFFQQRGSQLPGGILEQAAFQEQWQSSVETSPFSDSQEVYLENSGLVTLWPFLEEFFQTFGLVQEKQFVDASAQERGVLLLQYMVSGVFEMLEYQLPLNKLLCGMELSDPVFPQLDITPQERDETEDLLTAVIQHWSTLKQMSIDRFRAMFLLREGVLLKRDELWLVRVKEEPFDILMKGLPWSIQTVTLPWLDDPLITEWSSD